MTDDNTIIVFPYSSSAVDRAIDTHSMVVRYGLAYVPEMLMMEIIGAPGADPDFDPTSVWRITRQSDQQTVFIWAAPAGLADTA